MGPGFKYHVVTIASIFFALTIGLVVGSLTFSPYVAHSYNSTRNWLETRLNQELTEKTQENERLKKCLGAALPQVIGGKLNGQTVTILQIGDYPEELTGIREALDTAGAQVASAITTEREFGRQEAPLDQALQQLHADDARMPTDRAGLATAVADGIAQGDASPDGILAALEHAGLISLDTDGVSPAPVHLVVILAGSRTEGSDRITLVDQPLVVALKKLGVTVVMCEPEGAAVSDVPAYRALELDTATIDDIDSDIGKLTLIYALRGVKDDYGIKATAHTLMPSL